MSRSVILSLVLLLTFAMVVSCSGGTQNVVTPPEIRETVSEFAGGTYMMGLWQFSAEKATGDVSWTQLRGADAVINVIGFMEPPPLTLMDLDWPNLNIDPANNAIDVGVILTHPIAGDDVFMGFDVRGVCFGPKVANGDGATIIPGPEFFTGVPFGYQDGLVGVPDSTGNYTGLAGYKYFCDNLGADEDLATFFGVQANLDNRGSFGSGATNQRNYNLVWDDPGDFFVFNYAIYANYDWPVGDPPISIDNFAITTANSAEAFCADITEVSNGLYWVDGSTYGGSISLDAEVWDWQGNLVGVTVEAPGVIPVTAGVAGGAGSTNKSTMWNFVDVAGTPAASGDLDIIITATDAATFGESWFLDLLPAGHSLYSTAIYNAFIHTTTVSDVIPMTVTASANADCGFFNATFELTAISDPPGATINWDLDDDGQFDDGTGTPFTWSGLVPGDYIAVADADGLAQSDPVNVSVASTYPASWARSDTDPDLDYSWIDAYTNGTFGVYGDDVYSNRQMPFNFYYFNQLKPTGSTINLGSNGVCTFGYSGYLGLSNYQLNGGYVGYGMYNIVAVMWDDLVFTEGSSNSGVYFYTEGTAPTRKFVVEWHHVDGYYYPGNPMTIEVIFHEGTNAITMQCQDGDDGSYRSYGGSATVGIANGYSPYPTQYRQFSYNSQQWDDLLAISLYTCN